MKILKMVLIFLAIFLIAGIGMVLLINGSGNGGNPVTFHKTALGTITLGIDLPEKSGICNIIPGDSSKW